MSPRRLALPSALTLCCCTVQADVDGTTTVASGTGEAERATDEGDQDPSSDSGTADPEAEGGEGADTGGMSEGDSEGGGETGESGPTPTPGCGTEPGSVLSGTIDIDGTMRSYIVQLPEDYDPETPYPLIFGFHGSYDSGAGAQEGYRLYERWGGDVIVVYPDGEVQPNIDAPGWNFDPAGRDFDFFLGLYESLGTQLCIDQERVFSFGYSAGGYISNYLACYRGDLIRAVGSISGGAPSGIASCQRSVAAFLVHGETDTTVPVSAGEGARERWRQENGCGDTTRMGDRDGCVVHEDCDDGYPVVWCTHSEGHTFFGWSAEDAVAFFQSL